MWRSIHAITNKSAHYQPFHNTGSNTAGTKKGASPLPRLLKELTRKCKNLKSGIELDQKVPGLESWMALNPSNLFFLQKWPFCFKKSQKSPKPLGLHQKVRRFSPNIFSKTLSLNLLLKQLFFACQAIALRLIDNDASLHYDLSFNLDPYLKWFWFQT